MFGWNTMGRFMQRLPELLEGADAKLSSTKLCTYVVVFSLCYILIADTTTDDAEIALIAAGLALGQLGINRTADVKLAQNKTVADDNATNS